MRAKFTVGRISSITTASRFAPPQGRPFGENRRSRRQRGQVLKQVTRICTRKASAALGRASTGLGGCRAGVKTPSSAPRPGAPCACPFGGDTGGAPVANTLQCSTHELGGGAACTTQAPQGAVTLPPANTRAPLEKSASCPVGRAVQMVSAAPHPRFLLYPSA